VDGVGAAQVSGVDEDADFFLGFAGSRSREWFPWVELARGQVPHSVPRAALALREEHLFPTKKQHVDIDEVANDHGLSPSGLGHLYIPGKVAAASAPLASRFRKPLFEPSTTHTIVLSAHCSSWANGRTARSICYAIEPFPPVFVAVFDREGLPRAPTRRMFVCCSPCSAADSVAFAEIGDRKDVGPVEGGYVRLIGYCLVIQDWLSASYSSPDRSCSGARCSTWVPGPVRRARRGKSVAPRAGVALEVLTQDAVLS
jgi:hypothetical protein